MKTKILNIAFIVLLLVQVTSCYNTTVKKVARTEAENTDSISYAQQKAYLDSASEYMQFREGILAKLDNYDQFIKGLKEQMVLQPIGIRVKFKNQLNGFDFKNATLEIKIEEYKGNSNAEWELFKKELNDQVDELGKSINEMSEAIRQRK